MRALGIAVIVFCVCASACGEKIDNSQYAEPIGRILAEAPDWVEKTALGRRLWAVEREFYKSRSYLPAWIDGAETTPQWKALVSELKYSAVHGLEPASYGVDTFERAREESQTRFSGTRFPLEAVPELDTRMTYMYLRYAADLLGWTRSARQVHRQWLTDSKKEDLAGRLTTAPTGTMLAARFIEFGPVADACRSGARGGRGRADGDGPPPAERPRVGNRR